VFNTLSQEMLSEQGRRFLQEPQPLMLTKPMSLPERKGQAADGDLAYDETLFNRLRILRKALADGRDVQAYVVFSDVALRHMARDYPSNERNFLQISGVGRKLEQFGPTFLKTIGEHRVNYPPLILPN
jgi:ATP-dependent DNA helicase RecQ